MVLKATEKWVLTASELLKARIVVHENGFDGGFFKVCKDCVTHRQRSSPSITYLRYNTAQDGGGLRN